MTKLSLPSRRTLKNVKRKPKKNPNPEKKNYPENPISVEAIVCILSSTLLEKKWQVMKHCFQ